MPTDASQGLLNYAPETVWGTIPGSGKVRSRLTGETLTQDTDFITSQELRGDRQTPDQIRTNARVNGDTNHELSYGTFDDWFAGLAMEDWVGDVLEFPGVLFKSFFLERVYGDITGSPAGTGKYAHFTGMLLSRMRLEIAANQIVRPTFTWLGRFEQTSTTEGAGTAAAASTTQIMNAIDHVTATSEGGVSISFDYVDAEITVDNNLREQPAVGNFGPIGIGLGTIAVNGRMRAYYDSDAAAIIDKHLNWTPSSIQWTFADDAGNQYVLDVPVMRWSAGARPLPGINQDVFANMEFAAYLDAGGTEKTMVLTRSAA